MRSALWACLACLFFFFSLPARAAGEDAGAPTPAAPDIVPPVAIDAGSVPYPAGGSGDAVVIVEITVDTTGQVKLGKIVEGDGPFAEAVLVEAPKWTFVPARRADVPMAARIRMRVEFHAPKVVPEADAGAPDAAPRKATGIITGTVEEPEDVRVHGQRKELGQTTLAAGEVRQMPGAFGDAFRALEALPGVTPILSGAPYFFVRGAPPGNTGYFIDGVRVPILYHFALGPSVIHPGLIDHVDFFPGGYPARFGRFTGGILSGETKAPAREFHGEANIRLFDAGVLGEAPFANGRGSVLVGGRISYSALLLSLVAPNTRVSYWDYQGRISYRVSDRDTLAIFAFGSYDEVLNREDTKSQFYPLFRTEFHRIDLRWDHRTSRGNLRTAITLGIDNSLASISSNTSSEVIAETMGIRNEYEERLSSTAKLRLGADAILYHYSVNAQSNALFQSFTARDDVMFGVRGDVVWRVHPRIEIVPGVRFDMFTSRPAPQTPGPGATINLVSGKGGVGIPAFDPRVASKITLSKKAAFISTFGMAHQPPSSAIPIPGLDLGTLNEGLQSSVQASQGIELALPLDFSLTTTAFIQNYLNLTDQFATCITVSGNQADDSCVSKRVRGRGYGLEVLLRRDLTKRITGWISYTLSRSTRETTGPVVSSPGPVSINLPASASGDVLAEFDRTHVFNLVAAADLGAGWRAGARFYLYSGKPYTATQISGIPLPPYNQDRLPAFWRIDFRLEKKWTLGERGSISFVFEGLNVTFNREAIGAECRTTPGQIFDVCKPQYFGPVAIPSIGVEGFY
ncbi:MAG TPA: TonB-dependent receptor plug domain-containing protein [Polyangiaceae bacterium]